MTKKTAKKPAIQSVKRASTRPHGAPVEPVSLMEPLLIGEGSKHRGGLDDLITELSGAASALRARLPDSLVTPLADLVRSMNCYYSNLIEGHDTHPVDIERALNNDYSNNPKKQDLQREAKAHISVQAWIDEGGLIGRALSADGIRETHRRFCDELPDDMLRVDIPNADKQVQVIGGELRQHDVVVGRHVAISPDSVPEHLKRFESGYSGLSLNNSILSVACAHHRLLWIHPFVDGNGRVSRLISHAVLLEQLNTASIWSVARGLARNESQYKQLLMACDGPRRGDFDGRGNLSEQALAEFATFFLRTCLDQVSFMRQLIEPSQLRGRLMQWAVEEKRTGNLPNNSERVLEAILYRGELPRSEVPELLGVAERSARRVTHALMQTGIVTAPGKRDPLRLAFPVKVAKELMPGLFP